MTEPEYEIVYSIKGKHSTTLFRTAVGAVRSQIENVYQYEDDPKLMAAARRAVDTNDEPLASRILHSRSEWEYESFDWTYLYP